MQNPKINALNLMTYFVGCSR